MLSPILDFYGVFRSAGSILPLLDPYFLEIHRMCKTASMNFLRQGFQKLSSDIHVHTSQCSTLVCKGDTSSQCMGDSDFR